MKEVCYKERRHTDSKKWDACREQFGEEELLPLWVADMDFEAPACVREALRKYVRWRRNGSGSPREWFRQSTGWCRY